MMSCGDRTRDILDRAKRLKAKKRKSIITAASGAACMLVALAVTLIVVFSNPSSVPISGDNSNVSETSPTESLTSEESPLESREDSSNGEGSKSGDESEEESGDTSQDTSEAVIPEKGFEESRNHLIENTEQDFDVPQLLDDSTFYDALNNAKAAFTGTVKCFGDTLEKAKANTLITLYVDIAESFSGDYSGTVQFKCPYYYLKLFSENTEYVFFVFDYGSYQYAYGSNYFAALEKESFSCMVKDRSTGGTNPEVNSVAGISAYFSESYKNAVAFGARINDTDLPFTVKLEGEGCEITITRDTDGMAVSIFIGDEEKRFYRGAGSDDVYEADFDKMRLNKADGFSYALSLTKAFGMFIGEINQTFTERSLEEQHESGFYDFTDGSRIYSLSLDGELPGINTDDTFIGIIEYSEKAAEGATSTEGFENFEETLEDLMRFFGVTETEIPEKLDITADCGYEEGTTVFTGYIISYGEGFLNGDTPEFFCINIKPGEAIYGEAVMSLKIPAYFAGRLNPDKEYLFVCHENELTEPAGLLEINNDGTLSSPLGLNYYGGEFGLKSKDDYRIYYGINHIAAKRIRDTFIGLGNFSKDTEEFDLVYTPVDVYSGVADTNSEIRITYKDGKLTLQIYNKDRGSVYYFRDSESGNLYRLDENDDKIFPDSSEYLDRSMLISYIISVKALESTSGFLKNDSDIVYETPAGNKLTLGMEEGKLKTLSLNGSLLANIGYITFY